MANQPTRIGLYARISEDKDGQQSATSRQLADARALADRRGWQIADVFEDIDISAYKLTVKRPQFERMLAALRDGSIDGVIVWKFDRLSRQQRDLVSVMEACRLHNAFVVSVSEPIDTRESYGQFVAELLVAQARMESANAAARQRRKAQERREQGQPPRNGTRCFGYDLHYQHVVPEEAAIIREARDRLFAGETLYGVTRDFQKRGVLSPSGRPWRTDSFKQRLLSPTLAAVREFDGKTHPGTWPAIISPDDNRRLRLLLSRRPGSPRTSPARNYLLGGFLRCARCGGLLRGHLVAGDEGRRARYICITIVGTNNCARLSIKAEPLDEMVREAVIAAVDDAALRDALGARGQRDAGLLEAIRQDEAAQELLSHDFYVERVISREEYLSARRELMRRLEGNRAMLAKRTGANLLGSYLGDGEALRQAWEHGSLDWQRAVIGALIEHITILPGLPGRKPFDPNRVQPVWRY